MNRRNFIKNTGIVLGASGLAGYAGYKAIDNKITPDLDHSLLMKNSKKWSNWSGSQICEPREFFLPNNEFELIQKLKNSTEKIRVVGGGHSFSPVVPSNEILSSIRNIKGVISHDPKTNIAVIRAGSHLYDLTEEMHQLGYAFANQGDINRQSLGGAVSTSTHGTGETLQSFAGNVLAFRLITATGETIDCSPTANTDLFYGGVVSVGALGIVTQYTVQLLPKYKLKEKVYPAKLNDILDNFDAHIKENRNFELFPFFYSDMTLVKTLNITQEAVTKENPPALSDDFLLSLGITLSGNSGSRTEKIQNLVSTLLEPTERVGNSYEIYPSVRNVKFNEMEYELPREKAVTCLREIIATGHKNQFPILFPLEMRTVRADNFWLSPFYGRETVSISVHHYNGNDYNKYFPTFDAIFKKYEGRPHWGKLSYHTHDDFKRLYPKYDDFVKLRKELDPNRRFSNDYISKIFG